MNSDTENLISLAKVLSKPYLIASIILSVLLLISIGGNVYQATRETEVVIGGTDFVYSDNNTNSIKNE